MDCSYLRKKLLPNRPEMAVATIPQPAGSQWVQEHHLLQMYQMSDVRLHVISLCTHKCMSMPMHKCSNASAKMSSA